MKNKSTKVFLNPPPKDGKCYKCGIDIAKLRPFGKEGDPLNGNFEGVKLVKTFRSLIEENSRPDLDVIIEESTKLLKSNNNKWDKGIEITLEQKYGLRQVEMANLYEQLYSTVGASWECRDCIIK